MEDQDAFVYLELLKMEKEYKEKIKQRETELRQIIATEVKYKALQSENGALTTEISRLENVISEKLQSEAHLQGIIKELEKTQANLEDTVNSLKKEITLKINAIAAMEAQFETMRHESLKIEYDTQLGKLRARIDLLQNELIHFKLRDQAFVNHHDRYISCIAKLNEELESKDSRINKLEADLKLENTRNADLDKRNRCIEEKLAKEEQKFQALVDNCNNCYESLINVIYAVENEKRTLATEFEAKEKQHDHELNIAKEKNYFLHQEVIRAKCAIRNGNWNNLEKNAELKVMLSEKNKMEYSDIQMAVTNE